MKKYHIFQALSYITFCLVSLLAMALVLKPKQLIWDTPKILMVGIIVLLGYVCAVLLYGIYKNNKSIDEQEQKKVLQDLDIELKQKPVNGHTSIFVVMLSIMLLLSTTVDAQKTYYTISVRAAVINEDRTEWIWKPQIDRSLTITIEGNDLFIDNKGDSHIRMTSDTEKKRRKGGIEYTRSGIDEEDIKCLVSFMIWDDRSPSQIYLTYSDVKVAYSLAW